MTTEKHHITTTERAANSFEVVLRQWFSARVEAANPVDLTVTERPDSVGFFSASVIFDVVWMQDGARRSGSFVARMAPEATAMAVFPRYDMAEQFELLRTVSELSDVPVPHLHWMEPDASVLGTPFFVMERAHGLVPPDNLPYVFDGWLLDATSPQRQRLQDSSVEVLAKTHAIVEPESRFAALCPTHTLRQHVDAQRAYYRRQEIAVEPGRWSGSRDRSWGIRPVGEPEPAGRAASEPAEGFYWIYAPLRFDDFAVIVIIQESPDGYRTLNDAKRVWPDGRVEQLGWPRVEITYTPGTRHPEHARLHLTAMDGSPVTIEIQTVNFIALHVGAGYGGDPDWTHGQWKGANWSDAQTYDLTDPAVTDRRT